MESAIVGAVAGLLGAGIGAVVATVNARRQAELERRKQTRSIALDLAKAEYERSSDSPHSLAVYWKVMETVLLKHDVPLDPKNDERLLNAHRDITRTTCEQCYKDLA